MKNLIHNFLLIVLCSCNLNEPGDTFKLSSVESQEKGEFQTVTIGNQLWMAENLNVSHYRNGDPINSEDWCYYDNDSSNAKKYGKLYNFSAIMDPRGIGPEGWVLPSYSDFAKLTGYINDFFYSDTASNFYYQNKNRELKSSFDWKSGNYQSIFHSNKSGYKHDSTKYFPYQGNNKSGFNAYPSGYYDYVWNPNSGQGKHKHNHWSFEGKGDVAKWWIYPQNLYKNTFIYSKHEGFVGYVSVSMFEMNTVDIPQVQEINDGCFFSVRLINKLDENIK